jgi:hypothetical protein
VAYSDPYLATVPEGVAHWLIKHVAAGHDAWLQRALVQRDWLPITDPYPVPQHFVSLTGKLVSTPEAVLCAGCGTRPPTSELAPFERAEGGRSYAPPFSPKIAGQQTTISSFCWLCSRRDLTANPEPVLLGNVAIQLNAIFGSSLSSDYPHSAYAALICEQCLLWLYPQ